MFIDKKKYEDFYITEKLDFYSQVFCCGMFELTCGRVFSHLTFSRLSDNSLSQSMVLQEHFHPSSRIQANISFSPVILPMLDTGLSCHTCVQEVALTFPCRVPLIASALFNF